MPNLKSLSSFSRVLSWIGTRVVMRAIEQSLTIRSIPQTTWPMGLGPAGSRVHVEHGRDKDVRTRGVEYVLKHASVLSFTHSE